MLYIALGVSEVFIRSHDKLEIQMNSLKFTAVLFLFFFTGISAIADTGFNQSDVDLAKSACLAGSSYEFKTEADGSISVRNLEGKGSLSINKKSVTTVDLPDADKKEEFKEIRDCIKGYLIPKDNSFLKVPNMKKIDVSFGIQGLRDFCAQNPGVPPPATLLNPPQQSECNNGTTDTQRPVCICP